MHRASNEKELRVTKTRRTITRQQRLADTCAYPNARNEDHSDKNGQDITAKSLFDTLQLATIKMFRSIAFSTAVEMF